MLKKTISILLVLSLMLSAALYVGATDTEETAAVVTDEKTGTLVLKESFEGDISLWKIDDASKIDITESTASDGKKSVHVIDDRKDGTPSMISSYFSVTADESYTISADFKNESGNSVKVFLRFLNNADKILYNKSFGSTVGEWTTAKHSVIAPEGAVKGMLLIVGSKTAVSETYVDNIIVTTTAPKESIKSIEELYEVKEIPYNAPATEKDIIFSENFENGFPSDWTIEKADVKAVVTEDKASYGKCSLYVEDWSLTDKGGALSPFIEVDPDKMYTLTADIFNIAGTMRVWLKYFDKDKVQVFNASAGGETGMWKDVITFGSTPSNAKYAQIWAYTTSGSTDVGYVDNIKFYKGLYKKAEPEKPYIPPQQTAPVDAKLAAPVNNKLVYSEYSDKGDKIGDYSYSGFYGGEYNLPVTKELKVSSTLSPTGAYDDTEMIQKAIDKAASEVSGIDMRVVKLKAGRYNISSAGINMKSGVILSGEGQGPTGTVLYAKDAAKHSVVKFIGKEPVESGERVLITDDYIKSGSKTINISKEAVKNFKIGDSILVYHPSTDEWATAIGMKGITSSAGKDSSWDAGEVDMITERTITKINGTELTLDFAFFVPYMKEFAQSYIVKIDDSNRVVNAGAENLRIVSYYNGNPDDEEHATVAVSISYAKNIFIRDITAKHFYGSLISSGKRAKQITAVNCSSLEPVSKVSGSRRYTFACSTSAQQVLYTGCYSFDGRHDYETSFGVTGPITFVDNVADSSNSNSETHGTWSTGVLYDNIYQIKNDTKGLITLVNRGIYGTSLSQGWSAAGCIIWNSLSPVIVAHDLPLNYSNFVVGIWGLYKDEEALKIKNKNITSTRTMYRTTEHSQALDSHFLTDDKTSVAGDAYIESKYTPVNPRSLYKAQLSERFTGVISNARPNSPIIVTPKYDEKSDNGSVSVTGIYELGASKVTVYIDNIPYNASLKTETNEFEFTTTLAGGTHKIYATQTIDGTEGNKTADRFVIIGDQGENYDYLQSVYTPEQTTMLINDKRVTFDEIINGIKVNVNGNLLYSDVLPYETNGRVLVPMRAIFESFGAQVSWDEATMTATAVKDNTTIKITENQTTTYVNGNPVILDVPATIKDGRFVVPVRFISESFGAKADWIDETQTVVIEK